MVRATLKGVFAHKLRLALTGIAIVLGVAFVAGTFVFTDTIDKTFDNLFEDTFSGIDVVVQGETEFDVGFSGPPPIDESVLDVVAAVDGVAVAEGNVFGTAILVDKFGEAIVPTGPPTLGGSVNADERLDGNAVFREGRRPEAPDEVIIDAATAAENDIMVGNLVEVLVPIGNLRFEVVGIVGFGDEDNIAGATFTGWQLEEAQRVLDLEGVFNSISVVAAEGTTPELLRDAIAGTLPEGVEAVTAADEAADQAEALGEALGFIQTILLAFAGVAVFVGIFIIFNTFQIIVAQRTRELALYRAVGASGRQVLTMVLAEALILSVIASIVGIATGLGIAVGLTALMSGFGFDLPTTTATLATRTVIVGMAVGVIVTLLSAAIPAVKAARLPPIAALQQVETGAEWSRRKLSWAGGIVTAIGGFLVLNGLFGDIIDIGPVNELTAVLVGGLVFFVGVALLSVLVIKPLARVIGAPAARLGKITGTLARENSMRRPGRTAVTSAALMIGLALVGFFYILGASIKASVAVAIEGGLKADYVIGADGFGGGVSPTLAEEIAENPAIAAVTPLRFNFFDNDGNDDVLAAVDATTVEQTIELGIVAGSLEDLAAGGIFVSKDNADNDGVEVGDTIPMGFAATGLQQVEVVGIYEETGVVGTNYVSGLDFYEQNFTEQLDFQIYVKAETDSLAVRSGLETAARDFPNVSVSDQAEYREDQEAQVDVLLNLFQALLFLAVLIALFGITNTLVLSIYERTREIGLLRAVGMSRRQVRRMVRWEAVIVAVIGGVFGVLVGLFFGTVVVSALGGLGITELSIPIGQILFLLVIAAIAGVMAAYFPARRASRLNILEAITYE